MTWAWEGVVVQLPLDFCAIWERGVRLRQTCALFIAPVLLLGRGVVPLAGRQSCSCNREINFLSVNQILSPFHVMGCNFNSTQLSVFKDAF